VHEEWLPPGAALLKAGEFVLHLKRPTTADEGVPLQLEFVL
jgi:hypothetical protein